jgi:hypothetical protein
MYHYGPRTLQAEKQRNKASDSLRNKCLRLFCRQIRLTTLGLYMILRAEDRECTASARIHTCFLLKIRKSRLNCRTHRLKVTLVTSVYIAKQSPSHLPLLIRKREQPNARLIKPYQYANKHLLFPTQNKQKTRAKLYGKTPNSNCLDLSHQTNGSSG